MLSLILPMDLGRFRQFSITKRLYDAMPEEKEFIIPTRFEFAVARYLDDHDLMKDVRIIPYKVEYGFNPAKALNIGVRLAKSDNIVITSPEVKPLTYVLHQFEVSHGQNIIASVDDEDENEKITPLVNKSMRADTPAMYFLALFNKSDIEKINGWDEDFMRGYAYEDNDFGARWVRAGIPFEVREDIKGLHQYHERNETIEGGGAINRNKFNDNNSKEVIKCSNGLMLP